MELTWFVFSIILGLTSAHPLYLSRIPNGRNVPNPCLLANSTWIGVGHIAPGGGGPRNLFGLDFASAGHEWTHDLCEKDSDQDGMKNGEELGDPHCTWHTGDLPQQKATGHPGVCEPVSSNKCRRVNGGVNGVSQDGSCNTPL